MHAGADGSFKSQAFKVPYSFSCGHRLFSDVCFKNVWKSITMTR